MTNAKITTREAKRILNKNGFSFVRKRGSHNQYSKCGKTITITDKVNPCIWKRLVKENNLNVNV